MDKPCKSPCLTCRRLVEAFSDGICTGRAKDAGSFTVQVLQVGKRAKTVIGRGLLVTLNSQGYSSPARLLLMLSGRPMWEPGQKHGATELADTGPQRDLLDDFMMESLLKTHVSRGTSS